METGFRSSCVAYSRPFRVISSESFTPSSRHLPWRWQRLPLLTSPPLMPFSIDHYPASPSPLLASAQSENAGCSRTLPTRLPGSLPVRLLLTGDDEASIGDFGCLLCFDPCCPCAVPSDCRIWACQWWRLRGGPKRLFLSLDTGAIAFGRQPKCLLLMRRRSSVHFDDLINTGGLWSRVSPLFVLPSHLLPPCLTWLHLTRRYFIGSPPRINMVPH